MSRRLQILIATHVLAFAGACGVAKLVLSVPSRNAATAPQPKTKSSHRPLLVNRHDADRLMATFSEEHTDALTKYEK